MDHKKDLSVIQKTRYGLVNHEIPVQPPLVPLSATPCINHLLNDPFATQQPERTGSQAAKHHHHHGR